MMTDREHPLRIIIDPALPGALDMATDEAILSSVNDGNSPPTLRFYQWDQPTISLGYFQKITDFTSQDPAIAAMPVVRRQTGGGAILHDDELTYSLVLPLDHPIATSDIAALYQLVHDVFIESLAAWGVTATYRGGEDRGNSQRGPFFCFARTHRLDLVIGNDKLLGSAQRRVKDAVLQHGSLILARHFTQQPCAELLSNVNRPFELAELLAMLANGIADSLALHAKPAGLTDKECQYRNELLLKYQGDDWTAQR